MTRISGLSSFQWSASEQVYPFEKSVAGNTLYCKEVDCGTLPNSTQKLVAHGISGFDPLKLHRMESVALTSTRGMTMDNSRPDALANQIWVSVLAANIEIDTAINFGSLGYSGKVRLIYSK